MKKTISVIAVLLISLIILAGCGNNENKKKTEENGNQSSSSSINNQQTGDIGNVEKLTISDVKIKDANRFSFDAHILTTDNKLYHEYYNGDLIFITQLSNKAEKFIESADGYETKVMVLNTDNSISIIGYEAENGKRPTSTTICNIEDALPEDVQYVRENGFEPGKNFFEFIYLKEGSLYFSKYDSEGNAVVKDGKTIKDIKIKQIDNPGEPSIPNSNIKTMVKDYILYENGDLYQLASMYFGINVSDDFVDEVTISDSSNIDKNVENIFNSNNNNSFITYKNDKNNLYLFINNYEDEKIKYSLPKGLTTADIEAVHGGTYYDVVEFSNGEVYNIEETELILNETITEHNKQGKILKFCNTEEYYILKDNTIVDVD